MHFNLKYYFLSFISILFLTIPTFSQISSVESDGVTTTNYTSGNQDNIYVFCSAPEETVASLTAVYQSGGTATFEWSKYNSTSGSFDSFLTDSPGGATSEITNLEDGAYRVVATGIGGVETYTAWVFNNWYTATAEITESTCDYFQITASFEENEMVYNDLSSGQELQVLKGVEAKWEAEGEQVASALSPQIFNPPPRNTEYTLSITDDFGCGVQLDIVYDSIVTEASFTATPTNGEAPLEVTFTNESENVDEYEWFFFRDLYELAAAGLQNGSVEDSIMDKAIDESPIYIFENSGTYDVKLVTTKYYDGGFCSDTVYLDGYIVADTSFVAAPNVFTPNGDGANDEFVVQYWSLKEISIKIFNRWGKEVFEWENNNVSGFEETVSESIWDGKINGSYASPGVYYYVVDAIGRDDKKRNARGFVHLFTDK